MLAPKGFDFAQPDITTASFVVKQKNSRPKLNGYECLNLQYS